MVDGLFWEVRRTNTISDPITLRMKKLSCCESTASVMKASNWAVGTFVGTSFVGYEFCQYRRHRSIEGMKMAIEVLDRKKAEMERQRRIAEAEAEARRRTEEEAARLAEEAKKNRGWKFW